jgi:hypothetical protein
MLIKLKKEGLGMRIQIALRTVTKYSPIAITAMAILCIKKTYE